MDTINLIDSFAEFKEFKNIDRETMMRILEDVFRIPGIGSLVLVGIINRDYPVLLAAAMAITMIVLVTNLLVDLLATVIDPRQVRARS